MISKLFPYTHYGVECICSTAGISMAKPVKAPNTCWKRSFALHYLSYSLSMKK